LATRFSEIGLSEPHEVGASRTNHQSTLQRANLCINRNGFGHDLSEQPGRIFANNIAADGPTVNLRPRQELTAKWILPLKYLRQRMVDKKMDSSITIRDSLKDLTVGLFRRGCTENGTNASIISKEILAPPDENRSDYSFKVDQQS
jgi:hypothetical protein